MSPLAIQIYKQLRRRARKRQPFVTYKELVAVIGRATPKLATHQRSAKLHAALGEVSVACRAADLPCLPALVCRSGTGRPSTGYYKAAHPRVRSDRGRAEAWERELARVVDELARFPEVLP
ncbi:MAG TPA: hypothetical protein VN253_08425 [Kofleriaceae bacterium]|nr:hypothetical protein [Kofleriaceae bacterium]